MEIRENTDKLMSQVRISGKVYQNIMEGREMKNKKRFDIKRAMVPAAAAVLLMSTMYVGAGYIVEHTPLRHIFMQNGADEPLEVPRTQQMQEIYDEILDTNIPAAEPAAGGGESIPVSLGNFGDKIIDNELFSFEILEMTCAGRELSFTYILTNKTGEKLSVFPFIASDYYENSIESSFGDTLSQDELSKDSGYELAENQSLGICTQLGKTDYQSGMYNLYVDYIVHNIAEGIKVSESEDGTTMIACESEEGYEYVQAPIEIVGNDKYGLSLEGTIDKTERNVHFNAYHVYVTPLTVYLTLDGTYDEAITGDWGMESYHDIAIGFADGTETTARVMLSAMGYGFGEISVDMRASFDNAIDTAAIATVSLDGTVIMEQ